MKTRKVAHGVIYVYLSVFFSPAGGPALICFPAWSRHRPRTAPPDVQWSGRRRFFPAIFHPQSSIFSFHTPRIFAQGVGYRLSRVKNKKRPSKSPSNQPIMGLPSPALESL